MRVGALQDCPVLLHTAKTPRDTARPNSASSRMMLADLPPSSCATRFTVGAAFRATSTPARVEPVKETMSTSGCAESAAPTTGPAPFTRLKTPGGTPASCRISAKIRAFSGATSDGLSTIVHPAASAGATLQAIWFSGQFHGVMKAHTPTGSLTRRDVPRSVSNSKSARIFSMVRKCPMPDGTCACAARAVGAPISALTVAANSAERAA